MQPGASRVFTVRGMDCPDCASTIESAISRVAGVHQVSVQYGAGRLKVDYDPEQLGEEKVRRIVQRLGYRVLSPDDEPGSEKLLDLRLVEVRLALISGILLAVGALAPPPFTAWSFLLAALAGGIVPARRALGALRSFKLDMNSLMLLAVVGAFSIGDAPEGATVMFLFSVGEMMEGFASRRSHRALRELLERQPSTVRVVRDGETVTLAVEEVAVGERIEVRPGEVVPLDAVVLEGRSNVDQSAVTGESVPVERGPDDSIYCGTLNGNGRLVCRVTRPAQDSTLARVVRLVEQAQEKKATRQRSIDRFAHYYTPAVVLLAAAIALLGPLLLGGASQEWTYRALVVLVIACPCALVISTPVSVVSALTAAAREGILIKGGAFLEELARVRVVAFDKTGTLTRGRIRVQELVPEAGQPPRELLRLAAAVETGSEHPLGEAVVAAWGRSEPLPACSGFEARPGVGARARVEGKMICVGRPENHEAPRETVDRLRQQGLTVIEVRDEQRPLGLIGLSDEPRPETPEMIRELRRMGVEVLMLTGDHELPARRIAEKLGLEEVRAGLMPEDKLRSIQVLQSSGRAVAMVGDGINDAPALAAADVGLALGAIGSNVALETADVALLGHDLRGVVRSLRIGRRTVSTIWQNVVFSVAVKLAFLVLAVCGYAGMWMAIAADMGSSLLVTMNGLRLVLREEEPLPAPAAQAACCSGGCCGG
ncbi:MAG: cadmium-translocating P-type ATPase [Armatimonadetes bacterium]|nr:cadmium-translocating P-type ATPase [Armatimonadota bacterium]